MILDNKTKREQPYPERRREFLGVFFGARDAYGKSGGFLTASDQFLTKPAFFGHAESGWPAIQDFLVQSG